MTPEEFLKEIDKKIAEFKEIAAKTENGDNKPDNKPDDGPDGEPDNKPDNKPDDAPDKEPGKDPFLKWFDGDK